MSSLSGTKQQILKKATGELLSHLKSNKQLSDIIGILRKYGIEYDEESEYFVAAIAIAEAVKVDKALWNKVAKYNQYIKDKKYYEEQFKAFSGTWKGIKPKEEKGNGLLVSFPKANQISNGERDVISFLTMLMQARTKLRKEKCILIIDEIFDYLDDANLIAAQYYLTHMIEEFKSAGRKLFPLIMTHLNPSYFKNFCFKNQKVYYLSKVATTNRSLEKIILNRDDPSLKDKFSRYFLHFHPDDIDLCGELTALNLDVTYGTSSNFKTYIYGELLKYIENKNYEPLSVCCAIRVKIEENTYLKLEEKYREDYLDQHTTLKKLDFAESKGVNIPDIYYMSLSSSFIA
ncbi:MAG: hypothetical protein WCO89_10340 [Syntrophus sp. (in: bacteria)]